MLLIKNRMLFNFRFDALLVVFQSFFERMKQTFFDNMRKIYSVRQYFWWHRFAARSVLHCLLLFFDHCEEVALISATRCTIYTID